VPDSATDNYGQQPSFAADLLYVEDSADDFVLLKLASRKCGTPFSLQHAADGEQAVAYLAAPEPTLIAMSSRSRIWCCST